MGKDEEIQAERDGVKYLQKANPDTIVIWRGNPDYGMEWFAKETDMFFPNATCDTEMYVGKANIPPPPFSDDDRKGLESIIKVLKKCIYNPYNDKWEITRNQMPYNKTKFISFATKANIKNPERTYEILLDWIKHYDETIDPITEWYKSIKQRQPYRYVEIKTRGYPTSYLETNPPFLNNHKVMTLDALGRKALHKSVLCWKLSDGKWSAIQVDKDIKRLGQSATAFVGSERQGTQTTNELAFDIFAELKTLSDWNFENIFNADGSVKPGHQLFERSKKESAERQMMEAEDINTNLIKRTANPKKVIMIRKKKIGV